MSGKNDLFGLMDTRDQILVIGAHDGLSGRLGQRAGFDALWASGFEIAASQGLPDANILDMSAQLSAASEINDAVTVPVIADCDNGYGNGVNAAHMARKFFRAGIAAVCIEDNVFPKRCSFYEGVRRELVPAAEHALKVGACKDSTDGGLFVIARTEALIAGHTMEEALERAEEYDEAGADAILIHSREKTPDQIVEFAERWSRSTPLVAVPTTYDTITAGELFRLGYRIVIFANQGLRASIKAVQEAYGRLLTDGRAWGLRAQIAPLQTVFDLVDLKGLEESERKYLLGGPLDEFHAHAGVAGEVHHAR
jgi:phosphoenolpyruvate phosphomutase